jgi:hypothetical protein
VILPRVNTDLIVSGFPTRVREDAQVLADALPDAQHVMTARAQPVLVEEEEVNIPGRIYNPELSARSIRSLSNLQRLIGACAYSRHHDGYVRESSCAAITASAEHWVVPYVVQLLGEYVVEISTLILDRLTAQSSFTWPAYQEFVRANAAFIDLTQARAISYWSCYYRHAIARDRYPTLVALDRLRQAAEL